MSQCVMTKAMEPACSCTYDKIMAEMSIEELTAFFAQQDRNPRLAKIVAQALNVCTAKYR